MHDFKLDSTKEWWICPKCGYKVRVGSLYWVNWPKCKEQTNDVRPQNK